MSRRRPFAKVLLVCLAAIIAATCDAATALAPPYAEPVQLTFTGDTLVVIGRTVAPVVVAELRGEPVANVKFRLVSADTSVIGVTARQDSISGKRRGCTTLTVGLENALVGDDGPSITQRVCAVVAELTIAPASLAFASIGDTATLSAVARDGDEQIVSVPISWSSLNVGIAEVNEQTGRVTARGEGSTEIEASVDGVKTSIPIGVAQRLARFTFAPTAVVFDAFTAETTIVATARDSLGFPMTASVAIWESRDSTVAAVSPTGVITARSNGVTYVRGRRDAIVDSLRVEVRQRATRVVINSVAGFSINALGDELLLRGEGFDRLNHPILDIAPVWISLAAPVATVLPDRGLVTGQSIGEAPITARVDGIEDTVMIQVRNTPVSLEIVPSSKKFTYVTEEYQFNVIALNSRGASIPDLPITWRSSDSTVVSITATGRGTARSEGGATLSASAEGLTATATVEVEDQPSSIAIIPSSHSFAYVVDSMEPPVEIRNQAGDLLARGKVTWRSDNASVASVSSTGMIAALAVGTTKVRAEYAALRDSIEIVVRNDPASLVLSGTLDTLTAIGQELPYTADIRNAVGGVLTDPPQWASTNTSVATVTSSGLVTGVSYGTTRVIAWAGTVADTATVVVVNPTRIHVDNSVVVTPRLGTLARPFSSIQAAVNMADAYDTVIVRPGISPYSETISLARRVTLLGDSTAFLADGRNPSRLPVITHDTGTAGILAHTRAPVTVRYFSILHSVDGAAIDVRESDAQLEWIYVNPGVSGLRIGRGILLRDVTSAAVVANSVINEVAGYGIRVENSRNVRIAGVRVNAVGTVSGESGAGIHLVGGEGHLVELSRVRGTAGPHILGDNTPGLRISDNDLAGRHQLVRLLGASGATQISRNAFNLSLQPEDPGTTGSETDGRSGVEVRNATDVTLDANTFTEPGTRLMDAVRVIDSRSPSGVAVRLRDNRFHRGRHSVRSERSTWDMLRSRSDSAMLAIVAADADTLTLVDDTLAASIGGRCLMVSGSSSSVRVTRGRFDQCSPTASAVGEPAMEVAAADASLEVTGTSFVGQHHTAIRFNGRRLTVRGVDAQRSTPATATSFSAAGVIDAAGDTVLVAGTVIAQHGMLAGLAVGGGHVQLDSNRVTRNSTGVRIGAWTTLRMLDNDVFDNTVAGLLSTGAATIDVTGNWWGDALGPRRSTDLAAAGDSIVGAVTWDPVRAEPLSPGGGATALLKVRGDLQTVPRNTVAPIPLTVRVVDSSGRPVAGVPVTFSTSGGGTTFVSPSSGTTIVVSTDASGLAKAVIQLGSGTGTRTATASAAGIGSVTFTLTGT